MEFGFTNLPLKTSSSDGRNFILLADADYVARDGTIYRMPEGATSDGASTPAEIWALIPPFGVYWPAAYLHDCAYRNTLLKLTVDGKSWILATEPKERCDELLKEAMEALGVGLVRIEEIYEGVVVGGESSFDEDRK